MRRGMPRIEEETTPVRQPKRARAADTSVGSRRRLKPPQARGTPRRQVVLVVPSPVRNEYEDRARAVTRLKRTSANTVRTDPVFLDGENQGRCVCSPISTAGLRAQCRPTWPA